MRRQLLLAVAGVIILAACGSSDSSSSPSTTQPGTAAERAIANAGLVTDADLKDWAKLKPGASEATDLVLLAQGVPECQAFTDGNVREEVNGRSPGYLRGSVAVNSSVVVFATEEQAAAELELYRDPAIVKCLEAVYLEVLKSKSPTKVTVSPVAAEGVSNGFGFLITADIPGTSGPTTITAGIQGMQVGRALSSINVTGSPAEIAQVASSTLPNMEQRLQDAQA